MPSKYLMVLLALCVSACDGPLQAVTYGAMTPPTEQSDITFIVAGKTSNHRQSHSGEVSVLNFHFFAEIFLQTGGEAQDSSLETPLSKGLRVPFADSGYALEMHGGRYQSEPELEAAYPDGNYIFRYASPSIGSVSQLVTLGNPNDTGSGIPKAPQIYLNQSGRSVTPDNIDPQQDLVVTWSKFSAGDADPLGVVDDLLFVIMGDCNGVRRAHSGRPFENTPYLTYADMSFVIDASRLLPENVYQLSVEHAVLDTTLEHNVPAFATYASTTFLDIRTTGEADSGSACYSVRKKFDPGQTVL